MNEHDQDDEGMNDDWLDYNQLRLPPRLGFEIRILTGQARCILVGGK